MNQTDFAIIYLACGAPFGVYFFLQNRRSEKVYLLWIRTILTFVVWLPFAILLLLKKFRLDKKQFFSVNDEKRIFSIQKQIEEILVEKDSQISIYSFREIFERYIGLTAANYDQNNVTGAEKEIFRISGSSNTELAAICYYRRNRKRLSFHHTLARQDFLKFTAQLFEMSSDQKKFAKLSIEFVKLLNDSEAENKLGELFRNDSQTEKGFAVNPLEKDVWNPETHKPLPINPISPISTQLQTMSLTTNLRAKD